MNGWLKYRKWMACLCLLWASLSITAQVKTADIEHMILNDVAAHVGSADQSDDLTILCLKID